MAIVWWPANRNVRRLSTSCSSDIVWLVSGSTAPSSRVKRSSRSSGEARRAWIRPVTAALRRDSQKCMRRRPGRRRMHFWESRLRAAVTGLIHARRASPDDRDDLFTRLLGAVDPETSQTMSDEQLVDNLLTFLLAGHHTIAMALTWTLYLTSRAPEWEARMLEEIRQVVPSGPITGEHIDKLVTVQQVLKESLRLFPPLPLMSRYAAEDVELAGEHIKAGTLIGLPIYVIHRHRNLWDHPDRFDPSRFAPGRDVGYSRYQFMPFGAGPRIC